MTQFIGGGRPENPGNSAGGTCRDASTGSVFSLVYFFCTRAVLALLVLCVSIEANAVVFSVDDPNTYIDDVDADLTDSVCATAAGSCSLRAAVAQAMAMPGPDTIEVPAGTHVLTQGEIVIENSVGPANHLVIQGCCFGPRSQYLVFIDGNNQDRVFNLEGPVFVIMRWLTIQNGWIMGDGGAIRNNKSVLNLHGVTVRNSHATPTMTRTGGGIHSFSNDYENYGINQAILSITQGSKITGNSATGAGGGIANDPGSYLRIENSIVSSNTALDGGGIRHNGDPDNSGWAATISGSTVSNNNSFGNAGGGGGMAGCKALKIIESTFSDNESVAFGGGLHCSSSITNQIKIEKSIFRGNAARKNGGGLWLSSGNNTNISTSIIDHNQALGEDGGGVWNTGRLTIRNSTISDNSAALDGGGLHNSGATGNAGRLSLVNSTFSSNQGHEGGNLYSSSSSGGNSDGQCSPRAELLHVTFFSSEDPSSQSTGDVFNSGSGCLGVRNSIIATRCDGNVNNIVSYGHNLDIGVSCDFTHTGDIQSSPPLLGPLTDNGGPIFSGGPTRTHELLSGSPAIGSANSGMCTFRDQRFKSRFPFSLCDIGAYEVTNMKIVPAPHRLWSGFLSIEDESSRQQLFNSLLGTSPAPLATLEKDSNPRQDPTATECIPTESGNSSAPSPVIATEGDNKKRHEADKRRKDQEREQKAKERDRKKKEREADKQRKDQERQLKAKEKKRKKQEADTKQQTDCFNRYVKAGKSAKEAKKNCY